MSVYTELQAGDVERILAGYDVGGLLSFQGIAAGIENSNYFVESEGGRWVLTIFERMCAEDLPYFMHLMRYLAEQKGIPCPDVAIQRDGRLLFDFKGKQGCLVSRLPGATEVRLSAVQLQAAGAMLARLHVQAADFNERRANPTDVAWLLKTGRFMMPGVGERFGTEAAALLASELDWQQRQERGRLPAGVIHADYFSDNILFVGDEVSGIIDFYYACDDAYLYDLAIAAHALAVDGSGNEAARIDALLDGYEQVRPLDPAEYRAWPMMLRLAALRFWVSRLYDALYPRSGTVVHIKDPREYEQKLLWARAGA